MKRIIDAPTRATGVLTFAGHETFTLRHGWLAKAVDAVQKDGSAFNGEDAMVNLGVGKNMVRSIRHWALATGVIAETPASRGTNLYVTELGLPAEQKYRNMGVALLRSDKFMRTTNEW